MTIEPLGYWQPSPANPALSDLEVHLWLAHVDRGARDIHVLAGDERLRSAPFRFDRDRHRWEASHVLLRTVLARYLHLSPDKLVLDSRPTARPVLRWPPNSEWLRFSLSHSGELAIVAVAKDQEVGVDIEMRKPMQDLDMVAVSRRISGDDAAAHLQSLSPANRNKQFFLQWVRQEAVGKFLGTGLVDLQ